MKLGMASRNGKSIRRSRTAMESTTPGVVENGLQDPLHE